MHSVVVRDDGVIDGEQEPVAPEQEESVEMMAAALPPHWTEMPDDVGRFLAWAGSQGLSDRDVLSALGVGDIREFTGDKRAAMNAINAHIEANSKDDAGEAV